MREWYCGLLLLFCSSLNAEGVKPIRAIVSDSNMPPYAMFNADNVLQAGLSKDILDALGHHLNRPVTYLNLPRTRIESWLIDGKADVACFLNPDWVATPQLLAWTDVLFTTQQLLIRRRDATPVTGIQHLAAKRVGTTWGFTYPELEQVFRSGDVIRDDAHSLESNLMRLKQNRLDTVMTVDLSYHYYVKTTGEQSFAADPLWSEPPGVYCGLSQHSATNAMALKQGFSALVQNGFVAAQLAFYMGRTSSP